MTEKHSKKHPTQKKRAGFSLRSREINRFTPLYITTKRFQVQCKIDVDKILNSGKPHETGKKMTNLVESNMFSTQNHKIIHKMLKTCGNQRVKHSGADKIVPVLWKGAV